MKKIALSTIVLISASLWIWHSLLAIPIAINDDRFYIHKDGDSLCVPIESNREWDGSTDVTDMLIGIHGSDRGTGMTDEPIALTTMENADGRFLTCGLQFLEDDDLDAWNLDEDVLFWTEHYWSIGQLESDSTAAHPRPFRVTGHEVLDSVIARACETFPNLARITIAGQSAGANMVQKHAVVDWLDSTLTADHSVSLQYLVINAGHWMYLTEDRPVGSTVASVDTFATPDTTGAYYYDSNRYGLANIDEINGRTREECQTHYDGQRILYAVGSDDTLSITDTSTESLLQGTWRYRYGRAVTFWNSLRHEYDDYPAEQRLHVVEGNGHDATGMLLDPVVRWWIYESRRETGNGVVVDDDRDTNLDWTSLTAVQAATGLDSTRIRLAVVPQGDTLLAMSRTAAVAAAVPTTPENTPYESRGSVLGNTASAYQFNAAASSNHFEIDVAAAEDSTELLNRTLVLMVASVNDNGAGQVWYSTGNVTWPLYMIGGALRPRIQGEYPVTYGTTGQYNDSEIRIFAAAFFTDSLMVWVDNDLPSKAARDTTTYGASMVDSPYNTFFGCRRTDASPADGRLHALILYDLEATIPSEVEYFKLWTRLNNYLTGCFTTPQPALDYINTRHDGDGVIDTVHVRPGTYYSPLFAVTDSCVVDGDSAAAVVLDGSLLDNGPIVQISAAKVTVQGMTLKNSPDAGAAFYGTFAGSRFQNSMLYQCSPAVYSIVLGAPNSVTVDNVTIVGATDYGVRLPSAPIANQGILYFTDGIVTGSGTIGVTCEAGTLHLLSTLLYDNTDDTTGTSTNTDLITGQDPLFYNVPAFDYRISENSPANVSGYSGTYLGGLGLAPPGGGLPQPAPRTGTTDPTDPWNGQRAFYQQPWNSGTWGR